MRNKIIVFDFETTSLDMEFCDPVELAAVALDGKTLDIIPGSEFSVMIRPDDLDKDNYYLNHKSTIDWHLGLSENKSLSVDTLFDKWRKGVSEKDAWKAFAEYVSKYKLGNKYYEQPIAAGANIKDYDMKIYEKLNTKHKVKPFFNKRDQIDTKELSFYWFSFCNDPPRSYSMDDLRPYFGIASDGSHSAVADVKHEAQLVKTYMGLFKKHGKYLDLRGSCSSEQPSL